ncbi:hypothetical protein V9T40_006953 [Parthenolecanium corni]|uniref:Uncharacterized protein n=1 Tax=Parthenolecanium corni TaxID=536013 RepID=A0AAN9TXX9_9HEMI
MRADEFVRKHIDAIVDESILKKSDSIRHNGPKLSSTSINTPEECRSEIDEPLPVEHPVSIEASTPPDSTPREQQLENENKCENATKNWRNLAQKPLKKKRTYFDKDDL